MFSDLPFPPPPLPTPCLPPIRSTSTYEHDQPSLRNVTGIVVCPYPRRRVPHPETIDTEIKHTKKKKEKKDTKYWFSARSCSSTKILLSFTIESTLQCWNSAIFSVSTLPVSSIQFRLQRWWKWFPYFGFTWRQTLIFPSSKTPNQLIGISDWCIGTWVSYFSDWSQVAGYGTVSIDESDSPPPDLEILDASVPIPIWKYNSQIWLVNVLWDNWVYHVPGTAPQRLIINWMRKLSIDPMVFLLQFSPSLLSIWDRLLIVFVCFFIFVCVSVVLG